MNTNEEKFEKIDKSRLPLFYRLILKIPCADFLESCSSGVFWAVIVPIFLFLELFLNMYLLLFFPFPINIVLASMIPIIVFIVFLRISLERFIRWWNSEVAGTGFQWNIDKTVGEYLDLLKKKKKNNENQD